MMAAAKPRAIWSGSITFGLVNAPVRIYSAIQEHKLHFNLLHRKDDSPIGYEKICKKEDKSVPDDEIVKAFEYRKGEFVYMEDEDFAAAKVEGVHTIEITDFVPYADIDPIFFAKTYFIGPEQGADKVYSLLVRAMEGSELAGIAKFVMRDKQHLGCLRVRDGALTLEQLYFADEIRPIGEIKPKKARVEKRELEMAQALIENFAGKWDPSQYKDTYRDELCAVIKAKRKGKDVHEASEVEEPEEAIDLMEALRQSVERTKSGRTRTTRKTTRAGSSGKTRSRRSTKAKKRAA
jgi:DNA end-binding protein Ku